MMKEREMATTVNIPTANVARLVKKFSQMNKRAAKIGIENAIRYTLDNNRLFEVTRHTERGTAYQLPMTPVIVAMRDDIVLPGGWRLVAALDHRGQVAEDGTFVGPIVNAVPGQEIPASYRQAKATCDHCSTKRNRVDTFVVRNVDGEYAQVGRQCIADFLGSKDALTIAKEAAHLMAFIIGLNDEEGMYSRYTPTAWVLVEMLTTVAAIIRNSGWVPRSQRETAYPTADNAWAWFETHFAPIHHKNPSSVEYPPVETDDDAVTAQNAIAWVLAESPRNDFIHNLQSIARVGFVSQKTAGFAASIVSSYKKSVERELRYAAERKAADACHVSAFVGTEGERVRALSINILGTFESEGQYGLMTRVVFQDADGNDFVWFASGATRFAQGESYTVSLTVKRHNEWRGRKQTQVNRMTEAK
jgi:hypothetical protein